MTNINEEPNAIDNANAGASNEAFKREWEEKMADFKKWLDEKRGMFELSKEGVFPKFWIDLVHEFHYNKAQEVLGLSDEAMRRYGIVHAIIGSTTYYESTPDFDLPNGEIEKLFHKFIGEKQVEVGEEGLKK